MDEPTQQELAASGMQQAKWVRHFFLALVDEGFTEQQALLLARTWLASLLRGSE